MIWGAVEDHTLTASLYVQPNYTGSSFTRKRDFAAGSPAKVPLSVCHRIAKTQRPKPESLENTGFFVVRLKGFEPPTFWFVAKHSIQLSYSRVS